MNEPTHDHSPEADVRVELTRLWLKHLPVLETYLRGAIRDAHAREDVLQATGEHVSRSFDQYDRDRPFSAWIVGIAKFRVLDYYRDQQRDRLHFGEGVMGLLAEAAEDISEEIDGRVDALETCIGKLDPKHRKLLQMRYVDELKPKQLGDRLGVSSNAITAAVRRLRLRLSDCIERRMRKQGV